MYCSPPGSSVRGISQARALDRVVVLSFSRGSSDHWKPPGKPFALERKPLLWRMLWGHSKMVSFPSLCHRHQVIFLGSSLWEPGGVPEHKAPQDCSPRSFTLTLSLPQLSSHSFKLPFTGPCQFLILAASAPGKLNPAVSSFGSLSKVCPETSRLCCLHWFSVYSGYFFLIVGTSELFRYLPFLLKTVWFLKQYGRSALCLQGK